MSVLYTLEDQKRPKVLLMRSNTSLKSIIPLVFNKVVLNKVVKKKIIVCIFVIEY